MSNFEQLLADIKSDKSLLNTLLEAENFETAASKAQGLGYSVTAAELQTYLDSEDIELPGEVLTAVAGGRSKGRSSGPISNMPNVKPGAGLISAGGQNLIGLDAATMRGRRGR